MPARWGNFARSALALSILIQLAMSPGCSSDLAGEVEPDPEPPARPTVRATSPVLVGEALSVPSNLYVERDVWLSARATGIIEKVAVQRGERVEQGQELVVLETDLQRLELEIARQQLRYRSAEYERSRTLLDEEMLSDLDALRLEIARDLAASELALATAMLERCTLRAPFEGVVVERLAVPGQRVLEEDGTPLLRIVAADAPRAKAHVPEEHLAGIAVGSEARIHMLAGPRLVWRARIVFVSPTVDAASDTALVIVEATETDHSLRTGAAVEVSFAGQDSAASLLYRIPRRALSDQVGRGDRAANVLVAAAGRAEIRQVDVVEIDGLHATVRGRFQEEDLVILDGPAGLAPGDPVEARSTPR